MEDVTAFKALKVGILHVPVSGPVELLALVW